MIKSHFYLYVFVSVVFVVGAIFGALMVNALSLEQQQELAVEIDQYFTGVHMGIGSNTVESFWERLVFHSKWLILLWVLGITVIGIPGVLALNFLKGVLVGFPVGMMISEYAWNGVLFSLATVAPHNMIAVPAMIITSVAAISFAMFVVKNRIIQQGEGLGMQLGTYTSTGLAMLIMFAGAALFEAYVSPALISKIFEMMA